MAPDPLVRFSQVSKSYDGRALAIRSLDLDIMRGEFLTLLGPSGSGKTTTLMLLAGFEAATDGVILLEGRDITALPPHRRGLGVVFQNYALFPHMTVAENIAYPLRARRMAAAEIAARTARALAMVKLEGFAARRPAQLSGGQQQRVALARALVFEPPLILMDEPLGALDKQLREQMQYELKQLHERLAVTMVYVTHDQSEALTMSDRVAVFNDGAIQQLASPTQLYRNPRNAFVAGFVGENNIVPGRIAGVQGKYVAVEAGEGMVIRALAQDGFAIGDQVVLCFRPEHVRIGAAIQAENRFTLPAVRTIFLGDAIKLVLRLSATVEIFARMAPANAEELAQKQSVDAGWAADDCLAFRP